MSDYEQLVERLTAPCWQQEPIDIRNTAQEAADAIERLGSELANIACAAAHFDDKPHHLFSAIRQSVKDNPDWGERAVGLLDLCYENIHAWQKAERELAEARERSDDLWSALQRTDCKLRLFISEHPDPGADALAILSCNEKALTAPAPDPNECICKEINRPPDCPICGVPKPRPTSEAERREQEPAECDPSCDDPDCPYTH